MVILTRLDLKTTPLNTVNINSDQINWPSLIFKSKIYKMSEEIWLFELATLLQNFALDVLRCILRPCVPKDLFRFNC